MSGLTEEEARAIQPGDVVYLRENTRHYVVGTVQSTGIAAPLFQLEKIGNEKPAWHGAPIGPDEPDADPGWTSYRLCDPPHQGAPRRAPYRGGTRYSVRTLRARGEPIHPIPGDEVRPDEAYLDGPALRRRREALGLSQGQLARALGVDPNTIAVWERGPERGGRGARRIGNPVMVDLALRALEHAAHDRMEGR